MDKLWPKLQISFSTKVIVPVVAIMVMLLGITVWMLNHQLLKQFETEAAGNLARSERDFQSFQRSRTKALVERFRGLRAEPRYRAILQSGNLPTLVHAIEDLPNDQGVDITLFTSSKGTVLASAKRDPHIPAGEFEAGSAIATKHAIQGEDTVDTILVAGRLFDVVSIPTLSTSGSLAGALTFGFEIRDSDVREFSLKSGSQIVFLANGSVIFSTVRQRDPSPDFTELFNECATEKRKAGASALVKRTVLGTEHYLCSAGEFASVSSKGELGYLLLSSYEEPLRALQQTQQMLLWVSATGILVGIAIVWLLVRKVTQPLRALSVSAEAVGRGDFSQRVEVISRDECGELAAAFNQMTGNLKRSREQLESTVETLKTTQSQLVQSEKLSGIGEFVAGVAHELNNPLTAVMGFSELLKRADINPQFQRHLDLIYKSAQRCQKIVQNLLSFARRRQPERKLSNLNELVEGAIDFLQYQLRTSNIEVISRLDSKLPKVMVDPHQIQQVLLNILNNARQAIETHQPKGSIRITTEVCGQRVRVLFQDSGPGIAEENLSKVFDPFFTTKEVGKGTGLGLSICYGIVKEHGGSITVRSKPGEGATFVIEFPWSAETETPNQNGEVAELPDPNGREGAGKKVLVIDDEEPILQMVRETLSQHGYEVDVARNGEAALRRVNQTSYDLALCDWKMPGLNGQQIYERLRTSNPALSDRMIFITGDIINEKAQKFLRDRHKLCLSKPFSLVEFRAAISKALAA